MRACWSEEDHERDDLLTKFRPRLLSAQVGRETQGLLSSVVGNVLLHLGKAGFSALGSYVLGSLDGSRGGFSWGRDAGGQHQSPRS